MDSQPSQRTSDLSKSSHEIWVPLFLRLCGDALLAVMRETEVDRHYGVPLSLARLAATDPAAADGIIAKPRQLLPFMDAALVKAQEDILDRKSSKDHGLTQKYNVHIRLGGLAVHLDPTASVAAAPTLGDISAAHIDRLITIRGTVVRTGAVKLLESKRVYACSRCRHKFVVAADLEQGAQVELPSACPRPQPCNGTSFKHVDGGSLYTNYQEVQIQEGRACLGVGAAPRALTVVLQDDLADACQVGEVVEVTGVVIKQWGPTYPGMRCHVGLALQATALAVADERRTAVEVSPETARAFEDFWARARAEGTPVAARNAILGAFCPQLCGLFGVKLASLLMLIGGVPRRRGSDLGGGWGGGAGMSVGLSATGGTRGEIHFLLIGDPGTGKSQIQRYVSRLAPRAVLTSGKGSSAAGLTAAAVKDGAQWTLEAGALVLADGGVCCIDEFDAVREGDRAALHEAMEQQTCSVAKAGMVATLHTRAAVFGTCNPRGHRRYNTRRPLAEQIDISGPLLSRFDVVLLLLDDMNPIWDEAVAEHILDAHGEGDKQGGCSGAAAVASPGGPTAGAVVSAAALGAGQWSVETLRQYIAWVKATFHPAMTPEAEAVLSGYYQLRRGAAGRHAARTTLRLLESLVRLAQAHARLMARSAVTVGDAVAAVALLDSSVVDGDSVLGLPHGVGLSAPGDRFPERPDAAAAALQKAVVAATAACGGTGLLEWDGGRGAAGGGEGGNRGWG